MTEVIATPVATIVRLDETYDSLTEERLRALYKELLEAANRAAPARLIIDMSRTQFIGSRFVGVLFRAGSRLAERGGQLLIAGASPFCGEVLRVLQLDLVFPLYATCEAALGSLEGTSGGG